MKRKRGTSSPAPVGRILNDILKNLQLEGRVSREKIYKLWPRVVGDDWARHCWPSSLRGKTLTIGVKDSLWMQKLSLQRPRILAAISQELGPGLFEELRFIVESQPARNSKN